MHFFGVIYILVLVIILYFFLKMVYRKIAQKWREGFKEQHNCVNLPRT